MGVKWYPKQSSRGFQAWVRLKRRLSRCGGLHASMGFSVNRPYRIGTALDFLFVDLIRFLFAASLLARLHL